MALMGLLLCFAAGARASVGEEVGQSAPPFVLTTVTGKKFTLKKHRGRVVVLHWYATWCKPCLGEWPDIKKLAAQFRGKKVSLVGLDLGEPAGVARAYAKKHGLPFLVALDKDEEVFYRYAVPGMPYTVVVDQKGVVAMRSAKTDARVGLKIKQLLGGD